MAKVQVAFGKNNRVELLCEPWKLNRRKEVYHFVRNGHWNYSPKVHAHLGLEMLWQGVVPKKHDGHYNEAIDWINKKLESNCG